MKPGDIVKRYGVVGAADAGILYRVLHVSDLHEVEVLKRTNSFTTWVTEKAREVKLTPIIVMFDSCSVQPAPTDARAVIWQSECNLRIVDLVEMASEYVKLGLLIQDEVRRSCGEQQNAELQDQL